MALSDKRILEAMEQGHAVIEPFNREFLSTSSYDVCLGEWFYREQAPEFKDNVFNIYDPDHVKKVWGEPLLGAPASEVLTLPMANIRPDDRVILMAPGETILAHTDEFIGGRFDLTSSFL